MSRTQKVTVVKRRKKEIWAPCAACGKSTAHAVLTQVDTFDQVGGGEIQWASEFFTIKCGGCKTVSFCEQATNTEDMEYDEDGKPGYVVTQRVYPSRVAGRPILEDIAQLPHGIAMIYKQTHEAVCNKQTILAGIGLRVIVEAICENENAAGSNLLSKIDDLVSRNVITSSGGEILHTIRLIGNASAHEARPNSEEELATALEVVEHLLSSVYLIPQKAKRLKRK